MKSFLEKSKRALVLLLTGAMIATSVPADVFAAPLADDDVIIEEGADTVEALGAAEEAVTDEEPVVEETVDPVDPDLSFSDVSVKLNVATALADSGDPNPDWDEAETTDIPGRITYAKISSGDAPIAYTLSENSGKRATDVADSENGYQVYLYVEEGFDFATTPVASVKYVDYRTVNHGAEGVEKTAELSATAVEPEDTGLKAQLLLLKAQQLSLKTQVLRLNCCC